MRFFSFSSLLTVLLFAAPGFAQGKAARTAAPRKSADAGVATADAGFLGPQRPATGADAKSDTAPSAKPKSRFFEGMGSTPEQKAQLEELTRALELYDAESREFKREVQLLVEKKYEEKRNTLANSYEKA